MNSSAAIRRMTSADIPLGMELKALAGWNQTERDWLRFLRFCPDGCFVAEVDGQGCGTAVTTVWENKVGWISMILVHPEFRRRGVGTALMNACMDSLHAKNVPSIKLDATPAGKKVYDRLGFVDEYGLERREGVGKRMPAPEGRRFTPADLPSVAELDRTVYGVDRTPLLESLVRENPTRAWVSRGSAGELQGYALMREGARAWHLAPCVATSVRAAERLLAAAVTACDGEPLFLDVITENAEVVALATEFGFTCQRPFTRMYRGRNPWPGKPRFVVATSGPEKG